MFSRRHPFLFFVLVLTGMVFSFMIIMSSLFAVSTRKTRFDLGEKIGVVEINGVIRSSRTVLENLKKFRETPSIKAIVVRINSPGGAVGPSQEIYREIVKTREAKVVVASMGSIAASGGYYIASAADTVMANPGTLTGSIGVIMSYTNLEALFKKIGLTPVVIKSGEYKDMASPVNDLKPDEKVILQAFTDDIHQQFITDVAQGRNMTVEDVAALADGRIYTGKKARELGLVDKFGNLADAVELAGKKAGVKGKVSAVYPEKPSKFSILELLMGRSAKELVNDLPLNYEGVAGGYLYRPDM
ncbi:MAG: signal peptide peptidase SppA [Thermodesulfobacteriota bacterium]|nr:signal peptide peptidase SppA [Thermodesulfobacteriota bacterium]